MDLTTNDLYKQIKKLEKKNFERNAKPKRLSISIKSRLEEKNQIKTEDNLEKYFVILILNESNISNFIYNSSLNQKINICFKNLEYLSLTNNYLINLNFIINFPELFYLDVFGNPLEEFDALNYKNIFGYLRLTIEKFNEKKILVVNGLVCSILDIDIKDKTILKLFKLNNPNILMLNNQILYYVDFLIEKEVKRKTKRMSNLDSEEKNMKKNNSNEIINNFEINFDIQNSDNNKNKNHKKGNFVFKKNKSVMDYVELNETKNDIKINNKHLLEVKNFFEELTQVITKINKKTKGRIRPQFLFDEKLYINIERKRIMLLYNTYMKLNKINEIRKKDINYIYVKNIKAINRNDFTDKIKIFEVKQYIKCININIRFGIIILISMLFYCLNLVSMKMAITIIHYLLLKYYKLDEHKQFQYFNTFGNIHYLSYYLDNLEDFKIKLKFAEQSQIDLYQNILDILEVPKLILSLNKLKQKEYFFFKNKKNISHKTKVSTLISDIKDLKMEKDIFILIEFFCDFIQYENIEQLIINGSENDEYSALIELKELLEQIELKKNKLYVQDLSTKKFYKNKLESTFNKLFFENKKFKKIINKTFFQSYNENKKNSNKNKLNLITFFNNFNKEYKKVDEINTNNCLTIDKCSTKRRIKKNNTTNNKLRIIKSQEIKNVNNKIVNNLYEKESIEKDNYFKKNAFSNKNLKNKLKINFNAEHNLNFKTDNININSNEKNSKILESQTFGKTNPSIFGMLSSKTIFNDSNKFIDGSKTSKENDIINFNNINKTKHKKRTFEEIIKSKYFKIYFLKSSLNEKDNKMLKSLEEKRDLSNRNKKMKIKLKKDKELPHINLNAFRLYDKTKISKKKLALNNKLDVDLLVEKYNQENQSKIIRKILEKRNKFFQEKLKQSKNIVSFNKH